MSKFGSVLYRITLPYACYGIIARNGVVTQAAHMARWMEGRHIDYVRAWVERKGGTCEPYH